MRPTITVGSLFAGIGSFTKAFRDAGATVVWSNEKDRHAVETYRANFPDVRSILKPVEQTSVFDDELAPVDILTAGFPCQPFSVAGEQKGLRDARGNLFLEIIRLVGEFGADKPKILVLENVKGLREHDGGRTFDRIQLEIQKAGYWFNKTHARVLNTATHTPIPQNRERLFMVAYSMDHFASNTFEFPGPIASGLRRSVRDYLDSDRKGEEALYYKPGDRYYPHFAEAFEVGEPDAVYLLRRSYVRMNKSGLCFTLMAAMGDGGHNVPVIKDKWGIRALSVVECARLQGFCDTWFQIPSKMLPRQVLKQIGNSITVPMAGLLADECIRQLHAYDNVANEDNEDGMVFRQRQRAL